MKKIKYFIYIFIILSFVMMAPIKNLSSDESVQKNQPSLPEGWDRCKHSKDCVIILAPCDTAWAANILHKDVVKKYMETVHLITACASLVESTSNEDDFAPICKDHKCFAKRKPSITSNKKSNHSFKLKKEQTSSHN